MTKQTPLHKNHIERGAKMGAFAGYDMPLYYDEGVMKEHEWVRTQAGLFDVSHMGQITIRGAGAGAFWEKVTPSAFQILSHGRAKYTVMTNEKGGIIDDLIVTRLDDDSFFAVINAGTKDKDLAWIKQQLPDDLTLEIHDDRALLAIQGDKAARALSDLFGINTADLPYMMLQEDKLPDGTDIYVSRLGYTGEDGFELSVPAEKAPEVWDQLLSHDSVKPIGLAARDSLRLEMGYPLYGHDIDEDTTPVEAGLRWVMGKNNTDFIGAEHVLPQKENGAEKMRVGLKLIDKGVAREGALVLDADGNQIGAVTSGSFSPTLHEAIGMAYVSAEFAADDTSITVDVRGRKIAAKVCPMPFVTPKTKSAKKKAA